MGADRSLEGLVERLPFPVGIATLKRWCSKLKWKAKVAEWQRESSTKSSEIIRDELAKTEAAVTLGAMAKIKNSLEQLADVMQERTPEIVAGIRKALTEKGCSNLKSQRSILKNFESIVKMLSMLEQEKTEKNPDDLAKELSQFDNTSLSQEYTALLRSLG